MAKTVILVLGGGPSEHDAHVRAQMETWAPSLPDHVRVFWIKGRPSQKAQEDVHLNPENILSVPVDDSQYDQILAKTVSALQWLLEHEDFDYVFRTSASTYVVTEALQKQISMLPKARVAAGVVLNWYDAASCTGWPYVSGAGIFLSRDVVSKLATITTGQFDNWIDDVAIGLFLRNASVPLTHLPRTDLGELEPLEPTYCIRVKHWANPRITTKRMHEVHQIVQSGSRVRIAEFVRFDRRELWRLLRFRGTFSRWRIPEKFRAMKSSQRLRHQRFVELASAQTHDEQTWTTNLS